MVTTEYLRQLALALEGTRETQHRGFVAFAVQDVYLVLTGSETADFKFSADEQEFKCFTALDAFAPAPAEAGARGWTRAFLPNLSPVELRHALEVAWEHVAPKIRGSNEDESQCRTG